MIQNPHTYFSDFRVNHDLRSVKVHNHEFFGVTRIKASQGALWQRVRDSSFLQKVKRTYEASSGFKKNLRNSAPACLVRLLVPRLSDSLLQKCAKNAREANPDAEKQRAGRFGCSHPVGESSRLVGSRRWRGGRARFLHFELAKLEGQGDPLLGESFEFLVVGELLAHLRNKLRTNKLGGALAEMGVTELVEGAMFLWVGGIHALATGLLAGGILLR